jgi:hypothetical protein
MGLRDSINTIQLGARYCAWLFRCFDLPSWQAGERLFLADRKKGSSADKHTLSSSIELVETIIVFHACISSIFSVYDYLLSNR